MSMKTLFWEDNFSFVITNNKVFLFRVKEIKVFKVLRRQLLKIMLVVVSTNYL